MYQARGRGLWNLKSGVGKSCFAVAERRIAAVEGAQNMANTKHLKKGDVLPPPNPDYMRFYNMKFCPFAQRTRIVLLYKGIPHETVNVNLRYKPEWFLERNPFGLVPVLEYKDQVVYESRICDDFLDQLYPDKRLQAQCPFQKANDEILMHHFDGKVTKAIYRVMRPDPSKHVAARAAFQAGLTLLEHALGEQQFFGGSRLGMLDVHVYPWFERMPAIRELSRLMSEQANTTYDPLPAATFPRLTAWVHRMESLPAVRETMLPTEWHMQFMTSLFQRNPEYDIGYSVGEAAKL